MKKFERPFKPEKRFVKPLTERTLALGRIHFLKLAEIMRGDGRYFGIVADQFLAAEFDNLDIAKNNSYDVDEFCINGGRRAYEVKVASAGNAADLKPSSMKGIGRTYDRDRHMAMIAGIYGYIIIDLSRLPTVHLAGFSKEFAHRNGWVTEVPRKDLERLFLTGPSVLFDVFGWEP
jgi:hypothetical protein